MAELTERTHMATPSRSMHTMSQHEPASNAAPPQILHLEELPNVLRLQLQLLLPNQHRMPLFQLTLHHQQTFDRTCFFRFDGLLTTFHLIFPPPSTQHFIVRFSSQHFGPICVVVVVVFVSVVGGTSNERILLMKQMAPMGTIIVELQIMC